MVDERETVSDEQFFADTLAGKDEPKGETVQPEPKPEGDRPRDEQGRFIPKEGEAEATPETPAPIVEPEKPEAIPSWRLKEEADNRRAAEDRARAADERSRQVEAQMAQLRRQLAQQRPPEKLPDLIEQPDQYAAAIEQRLTRNIEQRFIRASISRAGKTHGEAFQKAWAAFDSSDDDHLFQRVRDSDDPGEEIVSWFRERETLREIGGDPQAYRQKLVADERTRLMADPEFRKEFMASLKTEAEQRPNTVMQLPSLNRQTAARRTEIDTEESDESYFKSLPRLNRSG